MLRAPGLSNGRWGGGSIEEKCEVGSDRFDENEGTYEYALQQQQSDAHAGSQHTHGRGDACFVAVPGLLHGGRGGGEAQGGGGDGDGALVVVRVGSGDLRPHDRISGGRLGVVDGDGRSHPEGGPGSLGDGVGVGPDQLGHHIPDLVRC